MMDPSLRNTTQLFGKLSIDKDRDVENGNDSDKEIVKWYSDPGIKFGKHVDWLYEDRKNEFKMHTSVSIEEVSKFSEMVDAEKVVRTLQPISKTICAFLNTQGGKVYLGISNNGMIRGIQMNDYLVEHFIYSLDDTLARFRPRPPHQAVKIAFYRVNDEDSSVERFEDAADNDGWGGVGSPLNAAGSRNGFQVTNAVHFLRGDRCTPCSTSFKSGITKVLIVLDVKKSTGPIYSNEEGLAYERTWVGNRMLTVDKLRQRLQAAEGDEGFKRIDQALAYKGPTIYHYE